jgi:hypothetical protein
MGWTLEQYLSATPLFFDKMARQYLSQKKGKAKKARYYDELPKGAW